MPESGDISGSLQEAVVTSLARLGALIAEVTATTRQLTAARDAATAKLNAGGGRNTAAILEEIAASMDDRAARFAKVVTWIETEASVLDAATTRWLDHAEQSRDDPGVRAVLGGLTEMGAVATSLAEAQRQSASGLDTLAAHETLRRPAGRHAASVERLIAPSGIVASIGERAQQMLDA